MSSTLTLPPLAPLSPSERRLAWGLALSVLAHLLVIAGVRPMTAEYLPPTPLQVELRQALQEPGTPLAMPVPPDAVAEAVAAAPPVLVSKAEPRPEPGALPDPRRDPRIPLERYFTSTDLDVRAEPLNDPPLIYPQRAYQMRVRGTVTLRVLISERGGVDDVAVVASEPRGVFEEAALDAARQLQFSPAMRFGRRVKSQKALEVAFDPYESIHIP